MNENMTHKQSKINTVIGLFSSATGAVIILLISIIGYGAKHEFESIVFKQDAQRDKIDAITVIVTKMQGSVEGLVSRIERLESAITQFVTKDKFEAELTRRDQQISDLIKEGDSLNRKIRALESHQIKP